MYGQSYILEISESNSIVCDSGIKHRIFEILYSKKKHCKQRAMLLILEI